MKINLLKIREHFLPLVRQGIKQHEYRLCRPNLRNCHIGDHLILASNQNADDYVKVIIDDINYFSNWEDALEQFWEDDFKSLFVTKEEAIKECHRFYSADEIAQFGIVRFKIKLHKKTLKSARVLLDTNIVIQRESNNNVSFDVAQVYKWLDKINAQKLLHPSTKDEISRYDKVILLKMKPV